MHTAVILTLTLNLIGEIDRVVIDRLLPLRSVYLLPLFFLIISHITVESPELCN